VLHTDVDPLLDIAVADNFIDDNTDCPWCNVVDNSGAAMVIFVGHTLLLSGVRLDINYIANTIVNKISRELYRAMFSEIPLEHMASPRPVTERVRHLELVLRSVGVEV